MAASNMPLKIPANVISCWQESDESELCAASPALRALRDYIDSTSSVVGTGDRYVLRFFVAVSLWPSLSLENDRSHLSHFQIHANEIRKYHNHATSAMQATMQTPLDQYLIGLLWIQ
jgi:hypothetical protein